jgi:hypothetical protein
MTKIILGVTEVQSFRFCLKRNVALIKLACTTVLPWNAVSFQIVNPDLLHLLLVAG